MRDERPDADSVAATSPRTERARVLELVRRYGFNTTSFQVLEEGLSYWWDSPDACVAFADTGSAWVAAGAPLASTERLADVAARFVAAARQRGRRAIFFASQDRLVGLVDMESVRVGLQPVWDPRDWSASRSRSLRYQLSRASRKGVVVRPVASAELLDQGSATRAAVERMIERWLGTRRMSPMAFLVAVQPFGFARERRAFVAERGGEIVGFVSAVPVYARGGWFLEDIVRDPDAPNGTTETLVDAVMRQAASEGSTWATLGLAPLAGPVPPWMRRIGAAARPLYDFAGVHAFKAKLGPVHWEPVYMTHPRDVPCPVALLEALRAFAGGRLSSFAVRTVLDGSSWILWTLAVLLVGWTITLTCVDGPRWFPSAVERGAWIVFDGAVVVALVALARRFTPRLGRVTAIAVTSDAILTFAQAVTWNAPRIRGVVDLGIVVLACLAPTFAACVLWRGVHREIDRTVAVGGAAAK